MRQRERSGSGEGGVRVFGDELGGGEEGTGDEGSEGGGLGGGSGGGDGSYGGRASDGGREEGCRVLTCFFTSLNVGPHICADLCFFLPHAHISHLLRPSRSFDKMSCWLITFTRLLKEGSNLT
jgi:hypothetical protein